MGLISSFKCAAASGLCPEARIHVLTRPTRSALDVQGKESIDRQEVATSLANQGVGTYDEVRETLKDVQVDAT